MKSLLAAAAAAASLFAASAPAAPITPGDAPKNIVEIAQAAGSFKTLLAAAQAAGLVAPLVGEGPLTVLAPTDDAFAALGDAQIAELLKPENKDTLARILKYHVIAGAVGSTDALKAGAAATLAGPEVSFGLEGGRLRINGDVNVIANDVKASNGVIHVIDKVLIPAPERPPGRLVIGFISEPCSPQLAAFLGVDADSARLITEVVDGSEAAKAGLRVFDVIAAVNGGAATEESITRAKEEAGYGGTVKLAVMRRGTKALFIDASVGVEH